MEVVLARGASPARVQGHLYPRRLCPDLGGGGGGGGVRTWDFQQAGLISCAGSCPGQGLGTSVLDHEQRPFQAQVAAFPCHFSSAAFVPTSCWKSWTFSSFHLSVISTNCAESAQNYLLMRCSNKVSLRSQTLFLLHVSGMHQV